MMIFGSNMISLENIARTAIDGDPLILRSLVQDWLSTTDLTEVDRPETQDHVVLAVAAGFVELFAQRTGQTAPTWTKDIAALFEAKYLVRSATTMKRLRQMCDQESPGPLKRRNLFAPADYLRFV